jgi:glycosyltransferase involved in cell wall biosynthesis
MGGIVSQVGGSRYAGTIASWSCVLRIALVNDWGYGGGAALAANRLARGLESDGHEIRRFYCDFAPGASLRATDQLVSSPRVFEFARRVRQRLGARAGPGRIEAGILQRRLIQAVAAWRPEVISVHNLHGAGLPVDTVRLLCGLAPVTWTLHDMWAFTGGCTHAGDCVGYERGCDTCERPDCTYVDPAAGRRARHAALSGLRDIVYVVPAEWLGVAAQKGLPSGSQVRVIPNGVNLDLFRQHPRHEARARFGISEEAVCVMFCAGWLGDSNKRLSALSDQLVSVREQGVRITLLTVGRDLPQGVREALGEDLVHLGVLDESDMPFAYSAADALVTVSVCETAPNTLIEAMACGVPTVGFENAGVRAILTQGATGTIVPMADWSALLAAVVAVGSSADRVDWSTRCRSEACERYGIDRMIGEHLDLFHKLLTAAGAPSQAPPL